MSRPLGHTLACAPRIILFSFHPIALESIPNTILVYVCEKTLSSGLINNNILWLVTHSESIRRVISVCSRYSEWSTHLFGNIQSISLFFFPYEIECGQMWKLLAQVYYLRMHMFWKEPQFSNDRWSSTARVGESVTPTILVNSCSTNKLNRSRPGNFRPSHRSAQPTAATYAAHSIQSSCFRTHTHTHSNFPFPTEWTYINNHTSGKTFPISSKNFV